MVADRLFKGKVILLYGARQTGKTTLVKAILAKHKGLYFSGDEPDIRDRFENRTSTGKDSCNVHKSLPDVQHTARLA